MRALHVKTFVPNRARHHFTMDKFPKPTTVFQANLQNLIRADFAEGDTVSVNKWALEHKLEQKTIDRLVKGQDPKLSTIQQIADKMEMPLWQLLAANLGEGLHTVKATASGTQVVPIGAPTQRGATIVTSLPGHPQRRATDQTTITKRSK